MQLSVDPSEIDSLAQLLYGKGDIPTPESQGNSPDGAVAANTQNPIPSSAGFYNALAGGQPQTQPQLSLPMMGQAAPQPQGAPPQAQPQAVPANTPMNPGSVPTMNGQGQVPAGPDPRQIFSDPNTLLLLGASLMGRGNNESILQSASRGFLAAQQYLNAKASQGKTDQRQAALDARANEESSARIRESNARTTNAEQQTAQSAGRFGLALEADKAKLDALRQQLANAQTTDARARVQLAIDNLSLRMKERYGDQQIEQDLALGAARTASAQAQARENAAGADLANAKAEALASLPPEDKRRVLLGAGAKSILDDEDRYWNFVNKNAGQFKDPMTGAVDVNAMNQAFLTGGKVAKGQSADVSGIPAAAVSHLRNNPQLKSAFDKKYGAGAADAVLNPRKKE